MIKKITLLTIATILLGCSANKDREVSRFFGKVPNGGKNIIPDTLDLVKITLDSVYCSYEGKGSITPDGRLYFYDQYLSKLFLFDTNGNFIETKWGAGRGPNEMPTRTRAINFMDDGRVGLYGTSFDWYIYDKDLNKIDEFRYARIENEDVALSTTSYTHRYMQKIFRNIGNKIYYPVYAGRKGVFNYLENTNEFLNKCGHIIEMDLETHSDTRVLNQGFPDAYHTDPMKRGFFTDSYFDIDHKGNFYTTFEADSLIYTYDKNFKPLECFGFQGRDMDLDFKSLEGWDDYQNSYVPERNKRGYYKWIEYDNHTGLLFRSYQKSGKAPNDGLQIYRGSTLIADVDVPKNFQVAGYIAPYFYSYLIADEDNEKLFIYKFQIPTIN